MAYRFGSQKGRNGADVFFADVPANPALRIISAVLCASLGWMRMAAHLAPCLHPSGEQCQGQHELKTRPDSGIPHAVQKCEYDVSKMMLVPSARALLLIPPR